ncbi:nucleoside hydrolase [Hymenopellis radicata]|nr:nucleoside hydrolase [Hymenopellis radicata]
MAWGRKALPLILPILPSFTAFTSAQSCSQTTKLIVDTDLFSDVDDAAALLLASTLPCTDLLAVQINYPSSYSVLAASSILTYYGHGDVPIGSSSPLNNDSFFDDFYYQFSDYASKVQYHWNHSLADAEGAWDSVTLYRKILSEQDDDSVTIASIGFFDNLSGLLNSTADSYSSLDGYDLVAAKVKKLAIMGGAYPSGWEYNFGGSSPLLTAHVVNTWPGSMTFSGSYLGGTSPPSSDPVSAAYKWYIGYNTPRYSWDPITVMYAVQGLGDLLEYGNFDGYNNVSSDGSNAWVNDTSVTNQHWLILREGVSNATLGDRLDDLYLSGAYHTWMSKGLL